MSIDDLIDAVQTYLTARHERDVFFAHTDRGWGATSAVDRADTARAAAQEQLDAYIDARVQATLTNMRYTRRAE